MSQTLELTDLTIHPSRFENSKTRAFCTATFNHALTVTGIRIIEGIEGIFVSFPKTGKKEKTSKVCPIVYPSNPDARKSIESRILATYVINHCVDDYEV
jgi:stage V sporulation protein G